MPEPVTHKQLFAQRAFRAVSAKDLSSNYWPTYGSFAKKFPALIHTCGLVQAVAFADADDDRRRVLHDLATVLNPEDSDAVGLTESVRSHGVRSYMLLSRHALAASLWIKRYTEARIKQAEAEIAAKESEEGNSLPPGIE